MCTRTTAGESTRDAVPGVGESILLELGTTSPGVTEIMLHAASGKRGEKEERFDDFQSR